MRNWKRFVEGDMAGEQFGATAAFPRHWNQCLYDPASEAIRISALRLLFLSTSVPV